MLLDSVKRVLDKFRLVPNDRNVEIFRQCRNDLRHSRLYIVDQRDSVVARLLADGDRGRWISVERKCVCRVRSTHFDASDVAKLDRKIVLRSNDDVVEIFCLRKFADRAQSDGFYPFVQCAARQFLILRSDGGSDLRDAEIVGAKPVRIDKEFYLLRPRTENNNLSDTVGRFDLVLDQRGNQIA